jgi:hypothetical protein
MPTISWLPRRTNDLIEAGVTALDRALGAALESAILVGDAMNPARGDRARAPEIVAIVSASVARDVAKLAEAVGPVMKSGLRVRVITDEEARRATDVFALEMSEWKDRHLLLAGADLVGPLTVSPRDLRASIELELRALARRIRNRVLTGIATERDDATAALVAGYDSFLVAAHHALPLFGETAPSDEPGLARAVSKRVGGDPARFLEALAALRAGRTVPSEARAYMALMDLVEPLTAAVDALEVAE